MFKALQATLIYLLAALFVLVPACTSPPEGAPDDIVVEAFVPWPQDFKHSALLVADVVIIEGPKGLLDHVALGQNDEFLDYEVETLPEGFRQSLTRKAAVGYFEIKVVLDALEITALKRVVVLERPGRVPVTVRAEGQAWWRSTDARGPYNPSDGVQGPAMRRGGVLDFRSE